MGRNKLASLVGWMIGVLGLAGIAVVGLNMLHVAREVDERESRRQAAAIDHGVRLLGEFAAGDLMSFAQWDEAVQKIVWDGSQRWMREYMGREMFPDAGEHRMLVVDEDGRAVFASDLDGAPDAAAGELTVAASAEVIGRAASVYEKALAEDLYLDDRYGDGLHYGIYAHDIVLVGDVPSLVVAAPLVGETEEVEVPDRPVMLLDIRPLTGQLLSQLDALSYLEGIAVLGDGEQAGGPVHAVRNRRGEEVAQLTWNHEPAGASVLRSAAPALGLSALVFAVLAALVSWGLRRGARQLAASEQAALHASRHDPATGLANRGWFLREFERIASQGTSGASHVMLIDCDYFKSINDTLGHAAGDAVLLAIADRLRGVGSGLDVAARLGGDEFAAITSRAASPDEANWLFVALSMVLMQPVSFEGGAIPVSVSIGIAPVVAGAAPQAIMARADLALYRAKRDGRGCFRVYDPAIDVAERQVGPAAPPAGRRTGNSGREAA